MTLKQTVARLLAILSTGLLGCIPATLLLGDLAAVLVNAAATLLVGLAAVYLDPNL